jgi:hypothetical protein
VQARDDTFHIIGHDGAISEQMAGADNPFDERIA